MRIFEALSALTFYWLCSFRMLEVGWKISLVYHFVDIDFCEVMNTKNFIFFMYPLSYYAAMFMIASFFKHKI